MRAERIVLAVGGAAFLLLAASFFGYTVDDAYISLRYARNWAEGHGPVWNPGESPPVEGYSDFLWVCLMALFERFIPAWAATATKVAGLLCGLACLPVVAGLARSFGTGPLGTSAAVALLAASPTFAFWSVAGLETPAFALALLGGVLCLRVRQPWYPVVLAVAALLRPEGAGFFALLWLWRLVADAAGAGGRPAVRKALRDGLIFAALYLPFLAWRFVTYSSLVPNTVFAKFAPMAGVRYFLWDFVQYFPLQCLATLAVFMLPGTTRVARLDRVPLVLLPAAMAASLVSCRPAMGYYFRFLWPVIPLCFIATGLCLEALERRFRRVPALLVLGALLLYPLLGIGAIRSTVRAQGTILDRAHRPLGVFVREAYPPGTVLALSDCGLVPYVSEARILDLWGLNDRTIARRGFDAVEVLDRKPDLIALVSRDADRLDPFFGWEGALAAQPRFLREYRWVRTFASTPYDYHLFLYERVGAQGSGLDLIPIRISVFRECRVRERWVSSQDLTPS